MFYASLIYTKTKGKKWGRLQSTKFYFVLKRFKRKRVQMKQINPAFWPSTANIDQNDTFWYGAPSLLHQCQHQQRLVGQFMKCSFNIKKTWSISNDMISKKKKKNGVKHCLPTVRICKLSYLTQLLLKLNVIFRFIFFYFFSCSCL